MSQLAGIENLKDVGALIPQIGALGSALFVVGGSVDYIKALGGGFDLLSNKTARLEASIGAVGEKITVLKGCINGLYGADSFGKLSKSAQQFADGLETMKIKS